MCRQWHPFSVHTLYKHHAFQRHGFVSSVLHRMSSGGIRIVVTSRQSRPSMGSQEFIWVVEDQRMAVCCWKLGGRSTVAPSMCAHQSVFWECCGAPSRLDWRRGRRLLLLLQFFFVSSLGFVEETIHGGVFASTGTVAALHCSYCRGYLVRCFMAEWKAEDGPAQEVGAIKANPTVRDSRHAFPRWESDPWMRTIATLRYPHP